MDLWKLCSRPLNATIDLITFINEVQDLVYYDGPVIFTFQTQSGMNCLAYLLDMKPVNMIYLVVEIKPHYLFTKPLLQNLLSSDVGLLMEYGGSKAIKIEHVDLIEIPSDMLPHSMDTFLKENK